MHCCTARHGRLLTYMPANIPLQNHVPANVTVEALLAAASSPDDQSALQRLPFIPPHARKELLRFVSKKTIRGCGLSKTPADL